MQKKIYKLAYRRASWSKNASSSAPALVFTNKKYQSIFTMTSFSAALL